MAPIPGPLPDRESAGNGPFSTHPEPLLNFRIDVYASNGERLHPCHPARARELIRKGRAVSRTPLKGIRLLKQVTPHTQTSDDAR